MKLLKLATVCFLSLALICGAGVCTAADIAVTAGSVLAASTATTSDVTAGATITAGQVVYLDASDSNKAKLAITTTAATANARGISLHGASSGQPLKIVVAGNLNPGGTVVVGKVYIVSPNNAGGIAPITDTGAGQYVTILGIGTTATAIKLNFTISGVAVP